MEETAPIFIKVEQAEDPLQDVLKEPQLSECQARVLDLILEGKSVFFTGSAGWFPPLYSNL